MYGLLSEVSVWMGKQASINHAVNTARTLWPLLNVDLAMTEKVWTFHLQSKLKSRPAKCLLIEDGHDTEPQFLMQCHFKFFQYCHWGSISYTYHHIVSIPGLTKHSHTYIPQCLPNIFCKTRNFFLLCFLTRVRLLGFYASPVLKSSCHISSTRPQMKSDHTFAVYVCKCDSYKLESFLKSLAAICQNTFECEICYFLKNYASHTPVFS